MQSDIVQRLEALHVWPQFVADHHADILTPRQIENLYAVGQVSTEAAAELTRLTEALRAAEEREKVLQEERDELLSQISDCRGSHWLGRQDRKGVTPHLDAIWRGLVEVDDAHQAIAGGSDAE